MSYAAVWCGADLESHPLWHAKKWVSRAYARWYHRFSVTATKEQAPAFSKYITSNLNRTMVPVPPLLPPPFLTACCLLAFTLDRLACSCLRAGYVLRSAERSIGWYQLARFSSGFAHVSCAVLRVAALTAVAQTPPHCQRPVFCRRRRALCISCLAIWCISLPASRGVCVCRLTAR